MRMEPPLSWAAHAMRVGVRDYNISHIVHPNGCGYNNRKKPARCFFFVRLPFAGFQLCFRPCEFRQVVDYYWIAPDGNG